MFFRQIMQALTNRNFVCINFLQMVVFEIEVVRVLGCGTRLSIGRLVSGFFVRISYGSFRGLLVNSNFGDVPEKESEVSFNKKNDGASG